MLRPARLLAVALALLALPALAQSNSKLYRAKTFTQNLTGSAPTTPEDGLPLDSTTGDLGWSVTTSAPVGQTITGGTLQCYFYAPVSSSSADNSEVTRRWTRCKSDLDITLGTGQRDAPSLNFVSYVKSGRIAYVPVGVTLSGAGTTVEVTIEVRRSP